VSVYWLIVGTREEINRGLSFLSACAVIPGWLGSRSGCGDGRASTAGSQKSNPGKHSDLHVKVPKDGNEACF